MSIRSAPAPGRTEPHVGGRNGPAEEATVVRALALATFLQWLGASAVLPLLPQYLHVRGGSDAVVGAVMSAFFAASLLLQFPAGKAADMIGRRPVLVAGLVCYATGAAGFLLSPGPAVDVALRALQGAGAGAAEVAALAMVSEAVPLERRGRAFGSVYAGQLAGMAFGPITGSLAGLGRMPWLFAVSAVAAVAACAPVLARTPSPHRAREGHQPSPGHGARTRLRLGRAARGSLVAAGALGLTFGVYEGCWTLLLLSRGAQDWQIGLSWTLFAVPFVVMARPGGWLADRLDRRLLVVVSLLSSVGFCALYPFLHSMAMLLGFGAIEAIGVAVALPSAQSLLSQAADVGELGRLQGLFSTSQTAAIAVAAAAGGSLFGAAPWAPFVAAALGAGLLTASLPLVWAPVAGRVADVRGAETAPTGAAAAGANGRGGHVTAAAGSPGAA